MMTHTPSSQRFLPWGLSWLTVVLVLLAVVTFLAISNPNGPYAIRMGSGGGAMESFGTNAVPPTPSGAPMVDSGATSGSADAQTSPDYYPYPYPTPDVPVTDTREFLKIYYSASMQTRDVPALTSRVETLVRGHDGRIDNESSSEKYGYVSFAVPQSTYDAFRTELESLVGSRFLKVSISSQNLLSQQVSLEDQQKQADGALTDATAARSKIMVAHTSAVQSLQAELQVADLSDAQRALLEQQLAKENSAYPASLRNADANVAYAQNWQKAVQTQDATLLANIATVNGTISIQWISLWDMLLLYLPGYWIPTIFAVLALLSYLRDRRR